MCSKIYYSNRKEAKKAARLIYKGPLHRKQRAYRCPHCLGFHLSTIKPSENKAILIRKGPEK